MNFIKYIIIISIISNVYAGEAKKQGDVINAKHINNQSFTVGDIKHSLLTESQYQNLMGDCWVKMIGQSSITLSDNSSQNIINTDYGQITGKSSLPNANGRFLRNTGVSTTGGDSVNIGELQEDSFKAHHHGNSRDNTAWSGAGSSKTNVTTRGYNIGDATVGGSETRPKGLGVNLFIKVNHECN